MFFRCMMYTNIIYTYTRIILENNNRHKRTNLSLSLSKKSSCVFKNNMWFSNFCILQVICIICILHNEASRPRLTHDSQTEQTERRGFLTPLTELQDGRGGFWIWILEDFPLLLLLFFSGGKSNDLVNSILFPYIQFIVFFGSLEDFGKSIDDERCGFGRIERFPRLAVSRFVLVILVPQRGWMSSSTGVWNICTLWKEIDMICVYWDVKLLGYYRCYIYIYVQVQLIVFNPFSNDFKDFQRSGWCKPAAVYESSTLQLSSYLELQGGPPWEISPCKFPLEGMP